MTDEHDPDYFSQTAPNRKARESDEPGAETVILTRREYDAIIRGITTNKDSIAALRRDADDIKEILQPIAQFFELMQSDINTLGRVGRALRSILAWAAAIIVSTGLLVATWKTGNLPGVDD